MMRCGARWIFHEGSLGSGHRESRLMEASGSFPPLFALEDFPEPPGTGRRESLAGSDDLLPLS
jgi:hypothetical protein